MGRVARRPFDGRRWTGWAAASGDELVRAAIRKDDATGGSTRSSGRHRSRSRSCTTQSMRPMKLHRPHRTFTFECFMVSTFSVSILERERPFLECLLPMDEFGEHQMARSRALSRRPISSFESVPRCDYVLRRRSFSSITDTISTCLNGRFRNSCGPRAAGVGRADRSGRGSRDGNELGFGIRTLAS